MLFRSETDKPTPRSMGKQGILYLIALAMLTCTHFAVIPIRAAEVVETIEFPRVRHSGYLDDTLYREIDLEEVAEMSARKAAVMEATKTSQDERMDALVNATYILETGHGKSRLWNTKFNAGGIKCGVEYCSYPSKEEGFKALRKLLSRYVDNHGYDLKAIRDIYSETDDTALFTSIYNKELRIIREGV